MAPSLPREPQAADGDGRATAEDRRIAAAACGFTGDADAARDFFGDDEPKVRAAALGALGRARRAEVGDVLRALSDPSPVVRRTACELATSLPAVDRSALLDDDDPSVVEACAFALGELEDHDSVERLAAVARSHSDPLCRESAVAALGAIGDDRGRSALLAALNDTHQIRRRAVVALANFEGDDIDDALRERLDDRDWQVRQAAEDILGVNGEERS